jgi:anti-sigma factor RsiW
MAPCPTSQQLSAYHDGELDEALRLEIQRHLPACPACSAELARLDALSKLLAESAPAKLSQIGLHRLHRRVEQAMEEGLIRFVRVLNTVAACVLIAGSAFLMMRSRQDRTVETSTPAAPPWVGVDVAEASDSSTGASTTPAAMWYLTDDSSRGGDNNP